MHHTVWFDDGGAGDHENYTISRLMGFSGEDEGHDSAEGMAVPSGDVDSHDAHVPTGW